MMKMRVIITGSTGMVGEGVLHECLNHAEVESVLVINRRPCQVQHPKLKEILHSDFYDLTAISSQLSGYHACFFCMGVSSVGMKEENYNHLTYDLTLNFCKAVVDANPGITLTYVSGVGTDSSEKGRVMWARVKGKTENHLMQLPVKAAFAFRPGFIQPTAGMKNTYRMYKVLSPLFPVLKALFPKYVCTLKEIGLAMIHCVSQGYPQKVLEVKDIVLLANRRA